MSDFVTRLAQRQMGQLTTVEPRLPSPFASMAAAAPMPVIEDVSTVVSDSPRSTNLPSPLDQVPSRVAAFRNEGNAVGAADPGIVRLPMQPREASQKAQRSAGEAATDESDAARQNAEPITAKTRSSFQRQVAGPELSGKFALPIATEASAATTPRREPQSPRQQYLSERSVPAPLVETRSTMPTSAPPRLETKAANSLEAAARERQSADAETPIHVTIGRIEVTAQTQAAPAKRASAPRTPAMSLDDYLARRRRRES